MGMGSPAVEILGTTRGWDSPVEILGTTRGWDSPVGILGTTWGWDTESCWNPGHYMGMGY